MSQPPLSSGPHAVLFVDDEPQACKWFARRYGDEFTVHVAGGVVEALASLAERSDEVAVLLTDYRMPERNGVDLLAAVCEAHPHVVRVLMSAYADKDVAMQAVNHGRVEHILEKPLDEPLTRQVLRTACDESRRRANDRALGERRAAMLRETLGFLAHEVRTPLATVSGYLTALRDRHAGGDAPGADTLQAAPGDTLRMIEAAQRRADYAQSLVTSFVNTAREAYRPEAVEALSASDLVRAVEQDYPFDEHEHERQRLRSSLGADFALPARQRDLLYLVLCTLVKNALQAQAAQNDPAPAIDISLCRLASPDGSAERPALVVADNGPGIPPELIHRLTREPVNSRPGSGGSGMGLLFCRRVMVSVGGDISVRDTPGGGATVVLHFPDISQEDDK
ncbi:MAG: hybrid sensor histidine kinase/response regulator [Hydrogenophaga sp.]|uniref:hybrid sensor histidine kinase/response regulator n=1 Tax=Hydrogenophaga sp. TaxID=1904254 RepID=UPI001D93C33A|nr:hybrid sensor histidine kinase/response regulator [Hydrogenophaga sp.]MBX3609343.1 hybrid sensor histidine kinase/response regulator [Hydrogenophaga sp.]